MTSFFAGTRLKWLLKRGYQVRKFTKVEHYLFEADGSPDYFTTEVLLQKKFSIKKIVFRGDVRELLREAMS